MSGGQQGPSVVGGPPSGPYAPPPPQSGSWFERNRTWVLVVAALLIGMAEVLRDNAAQTFLLAIVEPEQLERANGNLWGAEMVANSFAGPPLGSFLIAFMFALPFFVDAGTFAVYREPYDIAAAQAATQQAGLPTILADRLAVGA